MTAVAADAGEELEPEVGEVEEQQPALDPLADAKDRAVVDPFGGDLHGSRAPTEYADDGVELERGERVVGATRLRRAFQEVVQTDDGRVGGHHIAECREGSLEAASRLRDAFEQLDGYRTE